MRKPVLLVLICCLPFALTLKAQFYYYDNKYMENDLLIESGASFGLMNCITDLGGRKGSGKRFIKDINWNNSKMAFDIYVAGLYQNKAGLRLQAVFGNITAYDSILKKVAPGSFGRYERNLSFRSEIKEVQLLMEVHPLAIFIIDRDFMLSPYMLAGAGLFSFDPKASLKGTWYSLQPLRTEGQGFDEYPGREPYKLSQVNISAGIGMRYELNSSLIARFEFNYRILNTDYLDDVSTNYIDPGLFNIYLPINQAAVAQQLYSRTHEINPSDQRLIGGQRGNPGNNDAYFTLQLKLGIVMGRIRR